MRNKYFSKLLFSIAIFCVCFSNQSGFAIEQPIKIKPDGKKITFKLTSSEVDALFAGSKQLRFTTAVSGIMSSIASISAEGPIGSRISVFVNKGTTETRLGYSADLKMSGAKSFKKSLTLKSTGLAAQLPVAFAAEDPCAGIDKNSETFKQVKASLPFFPDDFICLLLTDNPTNGNGNPTPDPTGPTNSANGYGSFYAYIRRDTCNQSANKYTEQILFDLSAVDKSKYPDGMEFIVSLEDKQYSGDTASSVKDRSDGKFAPKPLVMLSSISSSNEKISLVKWKGNAYSVKPLSIGKYAGYRSYYLAIVVADGILSGGKGNFEINSESEMYSVCFNLTRTRQRANGYTN